MNARRRRNFPFCMICGKKPDPLSEHCGRQIELLLTIHVCNEDAAKIDWNAVYALPDEITLVDFIRALIASGLKTEQISEEIVKAITNGGGNHGQRQIDEPLDERRAGE